MSRIPRTDLVGWERVIRVTIVRTYGYYQSPVTTPLVQIVAMVLAVLAADRARSRYTFNTRNVYDTCMAKVRTNIELEDDYLRTIMDRYGIRTKTEAVELALRHLAGQPMTREEALAMRGTNAIGEVPADVGPRVVA